MLDALKRKVQRKVQRATPLRHKAVFYDITVSDIEAAVKRVRLGWVLGKGRPTQR